MDDYERGLIHGSALRDMLTLSADDDSSDPILAIAALRNLSERAKGEGPEFVRVLVEAWHDACTEVL